MKPISIFLLVFLIAKSAMSLAESTEIQCPEKIEANESIKGVEKLWNVEQDLGKKGKFLDSISIYLAPPKEMGNLIPDKEITKDHKKKYTWSLSEKSSEQYWAVCSYTNSTLLLSRPLSKSLTTCTLTENTLPTGVKLSIESMVCQ